MSDDLTGLVLVGGESRRFGADKALAPVGGRPMVVRVFDAVAAVAAHVWISTQPEDVRTLPVDARVVEDRHAGHGPLSGLHAGLHAARTPWLLAVACDLPFLTVDVLRTLADARAPGDEAVVARTRDGRLHPLCACYHRSMLPLVERRLASRRLALHGLLEEAAVRFVDVPESALRNVNRPEDLPG